MLLNILKYAEQPITTKNYPAPNVTVERLGNFGIDLYLRCNSRSFLCTDLDIFHSACLGKGTWTIMPHVPPGNTLGKLPFVASVLTDKQHLQKTPQFPHFELLGRWTWRPDGAHRPDTKKCRWELIFLLETSLERKQVWILFGFLFVKKFLILILFFFLVFETALGKLNIKQIWRNCYGKQVTKFTQKSCKQNNMVLVQNSPKKFRGKIYCVLSIQ